MHNLNELEIVQDFSYTYKEDDSDVEVKVKRITSNLYAVQTITTKGTEWSARLDIANEQQLAALMETQIQRFTSYQF